jgi:hypothetical protein
MFNHKALAGGPKNGLARLQRMAKSGCAVVHWERAINPTSRRLGISAAEAQRYALQTVQRLVATDYVEPVQQRGVWFDVYALYRGGLGWFVKIGEDDDGLLVISHHEPEKGSLSTVAGFVVKVVEPVTKVEPTGGAR